MRRRAKRGGRKLERGLEKAAKRLSIDTPVDKRRRRRTAGRAAWLIRLALAGAVLAAIYVAWRARNQREGTAEAGPAPDAFGAAVDAAEDGKHASTLTPTEGGPRLDGGPILVQRRRDHVVVLRGASATRIATSTEPRASPRRAHPTVTIAACAVECSWRQPSPAYFSSEARTLPGLRTAGIRSTTDASA